MHIIKATMQIVLMIFFLNFNISSVSSQKTNAVYKNIFDILTYFKGWVVQHNKFLSIDSSIH